MTLNLTCRPLKLTLTYFFMSFLLIDIYGSCIENTCIQRGVDLNFYYKSYNAIKNTHLIAYGITNVAAELKSRVVQ